AELNSTAAAARVLLPVARAGFPTLTFQPNLEPNTVTLKFSGRVDQVQPVVDFLQQTVPGFEHCEVSGPRVQSERAGRMIVGQYLLTGADVLGARKFPDVVARGAWPIEQWDATGKARFRYLPESEHYEIPARSLQATGIENLFMAGKSISADVDGIASAR